MVNNEAPGIPGRQIDEGEDAFFRYRIDEGEDAYFRYRIDEGKDAQHSEPML